jgi:hypothetical protein
MPVMIRALARSLLVMLVIGGTALAGAPSHTHTSKTASASKSSAKKPTKAKTKAKSTKTARAKHKSTRPTKKAAAKPARRSTKH